MGLMDGISAEDRIQIKFSDFYTLVKQAAKAILMANAVKCEVPHKYIMEMLTGESNLLSEYKTTDLSPEEIKERAEKLKEYEAFGLSPKELADVDRLYSDMCKKVANLTKRNEELEKEVASRATNIPEQATQTPCEDREPGTDTESVAEECPASAPENVEGGDTHTETPEKSKRPIDIGKIMALKNAGWKIKDIADEMHMEPQAVSNAIWRHKKSTEGKDNEKS